MTVAFSIEPVVRMSEDHDKRDLLGQTVVVSDGIDPQPHAHIILR